MEQRSLLIFTGQCLLALTLMAMTLCVTHTYKQIKLRQGAIHVKGCAEKQIQSDYVKWQCVITAIGETQTDAYQKLERDLKVIREYLEQEGIDLNSTEFLPISTNINYQRNDKGIILGKIDTYELCQSFIIGSSNVPLVTKVSQNITSLIKSGLSVNSYSPQYFYTKIDELKINMLGEAAKDALLRAEALVSKSTSKVGALLSAQQGIFQITPAFSTSVSDYGEYDTSSIAKRIKAVVTMEYAIDR
ncbi:MAG: SIMPL domain-containing protein [Parachlamydiaceae bacterium]